ncbi:MAG: tRNA(Ile2)-agmatinylcytidine synthase [Thermoplasmata archaeon]|jgi:tRNA(Ile2)-agmatinylcytidine synthase|nr:tRNA(Ile2)-agmatinylcytidine synthase [Thermoplasmata archaeon]
MDRSFEKGAPSPPTVLLAFDDTDSREGGCTTHLAFHVLLALPELALRGPPRLVRLNPNVPHKTRGNGAVVLPLGRPAGPQARVGELRGLEVLAFPEAEPVAATPALLKRAWHVVKKESRPEAQPSVVLVDEPPPAAAYWEAVRTRMDPGAAAEALATLGAHVRTATGRSLPGCLGALAWPGPPASFEFLAYRHPSRWGTARTVHPEPLAGLDGTGATFHTFDAQENRLACVPHGPDPVLLGLRGRDPDALVHAATRSLPWAVQEPVDGWLLWATNQASGDHATRVASLAEAPEWGTVDLDATVLGLPQDRRGGHVEVPLADAAGAAFAAWAFEPTKGLRQAARGLRPGDRVRVVGAVAEGGGAVNLEKLRVEELARHLLKAANPRCPECDRAMPSMGAGAGHRCRKCGARLPPGSVVAAEEPRTVAMGWHEPAVGARRHLHRPVAWGPA